MEIVFDVVECELGWLLVAGTPRGVCHVRFGDEPARLEAELREELPWAVRRRDPAGAAAWVDALRRALAGEAVELSLDVRGSRFQRRVWDAIRAIPPGGTRTYGEVARRIGQPRAARAVARACAANPVAVAIPCHRVVAADRRGGGYRWGAARGDALRRRERARTAV